MYNVTMKGILKEDYIVITEKKDLSKLYSKGGFGKVMPQGKLRLNLVEGAYLLEKKKIKIIYDDEEISFSSFFDEHVKADSRFEHRYMAYRDLKKRGYRIRCCREGNFDFSLISKQSGDNTREMFVSVWSERERFHLDIIKELYNNIKIPFWIAVVDEEGDVTYYEVLKPDLGGDIKMKYQNLGLGILIKNHVFIFDKDASSILLREGFFGKPFSGGLQLSLIEAIYLSEKNVIEIEYNRRDLKFGELVEIAKKQQPDIEIRYKVYSDLKTRGLSVKTGFKFGTNFRAYERDPHKFHAEYLIDVVDSRFESSWPIVSRAVRLAHSVKKLYTFAMVDDGIDYLSIRRIRP